jgi:methylmalonyl-CoA mutase N-terminal domain/subunit
MRDRFGATNPRALALRLPRADAASTLTAQQPENNTCASPSRRCPRSAAARSRSTPTRSDEALALPTEHAATIALRTQQILATRPAPPTRRPARRLVLRRGATDDSPSGVRAHRASTKLSAVAAIEQGFVQAEIEASAFRFQTDRSRASASSSV